MGPHRLPTMRSSSMTKGAALNCSPAAHVLLRTSVPMGRHKPAANVRPAGLPVASTTTSYWPACAGATPLNAVVSLVSSTNRQSTPLVLTKSSLCGCFPNRVTLSKDRPKTSAIISPNFPSPRMAMRSCSRINPCSGIRQAAANGSAKTATSSDTVCGTTCKFLTGSVKYSAMVPCRLRIPKTLR